MKDTKMMTSCLENAWSEAINYTLFAEKIELFKKLSKDEQLALQNAHCQDLARPIGELNDNLYIIKILIDHVILYFKMVIMMYEHESISKQDAINIIKPKKADYVDGIYSLYFQKAHKEIFDKIQALVK